MKKKRQSKSPFQFEDRDAALFTVVLVTAFLLGAIFVLILLTLPKW